MQKDESSLYDESYFLRGRTFFLQHKGHRLSARLARPFAHANVTPRDTVLDLGFGRGELAFQCAKRGARVFGYDFSLAAHAIARAVIAQLPAPRRKLVTLRHTDFLSRRARLPRASVVFLVDVLEHLEPTSARSLLRKIAACLLPHGRIVIRTRLGRRLATRHTPDLAPGEQTYLMHIGHHCIYTARAIQGMLRSELTLVRPHSTILLAVGNTSPSPGTERHGERH